MCCLKKNRRLVVVLGKIVAMPILKKPSASTGAFQAPRPSLTSPPPPMTTMSNPESENVPPEDVAPEAKSCASVSLAIKPSFSLHKNYSAPAILKQAQPSVPAPVAAHIQLKRPAPSLHSSPSDSSAPPLKKPANFIAPRQSDSAALVAQQPPPPPAAPASVEATPLL